MSRVKPLVPTVFVPCGFSTRCDHHAGYQVALFGNHAAQKGPATACRVHLRATIDAFMDVSPNSVRVRSTR